MTEEQDINVKKILKSLPSGLYYWDSESLKFCHVEIASEIKMKKLIFCIME